MLGACTTQVFDLTASSIAPIAKETLRRIGELHDIEKAIRRVSPVARKTARQKSSRPIIKALRSRLDNNLNRLPQKSGTAETILRNVLTSIADYPINRIVELLPWKLELPPQTA